MSNLKLRIFAEPLVGQQYCILCNKKKTKFVLISCIPDNTTINIESKLQGIYTLELQGARHHLLQASPSMAGPVTCKYKQI